MMILADVSSGRSETASASLFDALTADLAKLPDGSKAARVDAFLADVKSQGGNPLEDAGDRLSTDPAAWVLHPGEAWHGFDDADGAHLEDDYCMLDPIKVTVIMPGVNDDGSLARWGIPAAVVVKFLDTRGIVNEKSGDYSILFIIAAGVYLISLLINVLLAPGLKRVELVL